MDKLTTFIKIAESMSDEELNTLYNKVGVVEWAMSILNKEKTKRGI